MNLKHRFITTKIFDALKVSPVVFLNGARQAGKSTLVQNLVTNRNLLILCRRPIFHADETPPTLFFYRV